MIRRNCARQWAPCARPETDGQGSNGTSVQQGKNSKRRVMRRFAHARRQMVQRKYQQRVRENILRELRDGIICLEQDRINEAQRALHQDEYEGLNYQVLLHERSFTPTPNSFRPEKLSQFWQVPHSTKLARLGRILRLETSLNRSACLSPHTGVSPASIAVCQI